MLKVRDERIRRAWSQTRLSGLTGIAQSDISAIETGRRPAWPGERRRIALVMGVPESDLFHVDTDSHAESVNAAV